ncbi:MAG: amidohydrolase family protein [Candidatus Izemoplasmatales bacterium]
MLQIPAFIDSHLHFLGLGYYDEIVNLNNALSIGEIYNLVENIDSEIVYGRGFNQENLIDQRMPTKNDFNKINKPLVLLRVCGHVAVVNQAMLDLMGFTKSTKQINGGSFNYDTGLFTERTLDYIYQALPKPTKEDIKRYAMKANRRLLENGITKIASDDFSTFNLPYELIVEAINEAYEENLIDVEITEQVNLPIDKLKDFINKGYVNKRFNNFRMGPLKILADGSLGGRTAALKKEYSDDSNNLGILTYTDIELYELVGLASKNDMDTVIHAIGDRACEQALKAIIKAQKKYPRKTPCNAIIHAQVTSKSQIDLMRKNNISAIVQPIFINTDIKIVNERLSERSKESYLFKTMYNNIQLGFSTDSPVETVNPFHNLYCAITRNSIDNPMYKPFNELERFSLEEALDAYTYNNLRFVYSNSLDDYIEIDQDIFKTDTSNIKDIIVLKTFKNNKLVYKREN